MQGSVRRHRHRVADLLADGRRRLALHDCSGDLEHDHHHHHGIGGRWLDTRESADSGSRPSRTWGTPRSCGTRRSEFAFAGQEWTSLTVAADGYIVIGGIGDGGSTAENLNLPSPNAPHNILAPFWTDLNPAAAPTAPTPGGIRIATLTDGTHTWIVVDWDRVPNTLGGAQNTFEVWIEDDTGGFPEQITYSYGTMSAGSASGVTVGAQDVSGTRGATGLFNGTGTAAATNTEQRVTSVP